MSHNDELIATIADKRGVSADAVTTALAALTRGNGTMAQFSHADFGGMTQWSKGGMSMVGDMFNSGMKAKLDGVMSIWQPPFKVEKSSRRKAISVRPPMGMRRRRLTAADVSGPRSSARRRPRGARTICATPSSRKSSA